jgi:hypothetical protein
VRIRIIVQPRGFVDGVSLRHYLLGHVYDVSAALAEYLVADGSAQLEMRSRQRSRRPRPNERRRLNSGLFRQNDGPGHWSV